MLKGLTNTIKNACNDIELTLSEYIVIGGKTIPIKAELNDDCYDNGNFIGTFILKELKFEASNEISYINKEFEYYKRINGESIKIGTFITTEINNSDSEEVTKVVAMDYGLKTQIEYKSNLDYSSGNITLLDVWNECCELSGLESGVTEFTNSDFIVTDDQFTGTGATIRDVFIGIGLSSGSFIKVMNDDKIYPIFNEYDSNIKSGNNITLENDINNNPIDIQIDGNTEQTTYTGKNVIPLKQYNYTNKGVTVTTDIETGIITINGTCEEDNTAYVIYDDFILNGSYTFNLIYLSGTISNTTNTTRLHIADKDWGNQFYLPFVNSNNYTSRKNISNVTYKYHFIRIDKNVTFNNYKVKAQLVKGINSDYDYEPYVGGQPSPNPDYPQEIKSVSGVENLLDESLLVDTSTTNGITFEKNDDNTFNLSGTVVGSTYNKTLLTLSEDLQPNENYYFYCSQPYNSATFNICVRVYFSDNTFQNIIPDRDTKIQNKKITATYVVFYAGVGTTVDTANNVRLMLSKKASDYVPYGHWLKVKNTGKNLFDINNQYKVGQSFEYKGITITYNENGYITLNGTASANGDINIVPKNYTITLDKDIYLCFEKASGSISVDRGFSCEAINKSGGSIWSYGVKESAPIKKVPYSDIVSIRWLRISLTSGTAFTNYKIRCWVSTENSLDFEPYKETSTLIDMNKYDSEGNITDYYELSSIGDTKDELNIDKDGNVSITQNIGEAVLNGTETGWGKSGATGNVSYYYSAVYGTSGYKFNDIDLTNVGTTSSTTPVPAYCDYFQSIAGNKIFTDIKGLTFDYISNTKTIELRLGFGLDTTITTVDLLKTWLSTHPVTVKYILDKPQTISLGKMSPLKLLEGTNNITTNDELQPNMKIEYSVINEIVEEYTELEDKRDTQPITCLRLGLSQIEGENVDIQDEDLIKKYGEHWLIINDNPFAYTQEKRVELINAIFDKVKGFGYSSFVSKTSFKPYLTCGDVIKFRNKAGELVKSIVLRYNHNFDEITLEAPSETSATVNYVYPTKDIDLIKRTEIILDKNTNQITSLTQQTTSIQNDLQQNYYDITQTNQLIQTSSTGLTNTFSEAGGNNIFRNTGLWFSQSDANNPYEYWTGKNVSKQNTDKSSNGSLMMLKKGTLEQEQVVSNGNYTVSFKYKKLIQLATCKVIVNDNEYELTQMTDTEWQTGLKDADGNIVIKPLEVTSNHINVKFTSTVDNAIEIYDLMVNAGTVKLAYSQNENEVTTDTVNISKGITITSSANDTKFKANADGIRIVDKNNEKTILTEFTDKGMSTKQMEVENGATIVKVLVQNVGNQTWFTRI